MAADTLSMSDLDLFADEVLLDPYPYHAALREHAAVVHLEHTASGVWALPRYQTIREVLGNTQVFSSKAVAFNDAMNQAMEGTTLASDPPDHKPLRRALMENLSPRALRPLQADIDAKADAMVGALVERGTFDAVEDLAQALPVTVVTDLIGVQGEVRDKMLTWGEAAFNVLGPMNQRTADNFPVTGELLAWAQGIKATDLAEGSIGQAVFAAADRGLIPHESCNGIIFQYVAGGLDSSIASIGNAIAALAANPDQYDLIRENPELIPAAWNEALRYDTPAPVFGRLTTEDVEIEGTVIPAGEQVALLVAAGNHDPRHYQDPDAFQVRRNPGDHLAFGYSAHRCAGEGLVKLEALAVLGALTRRARRLTIEQPQRHLSNWTRSWEKLPVVAIEPA